MDDRERDWQEDYYYAIATLDRIFIEAKTVEEAKKWAFEALNELEEVMVVDIFENVN